MQVHALRENAKTVMVVAPGVVLGRKYRLKHLLGEGGMGVVWAAEHTETGRKVALKLIKESEADPEMRRRFLREARAASAVRHPNVVTILEVLELPDGSPAMVMELLEGESLYAELTRERRLSLPEVIEVLLPVISAVGTAHSFGVVHRDLKPENIFLTRGGSGERVVKVLDFGIAKLTALDGEAARTSGITTGIVLGTPSYMAPEQVFGEKDIDHRVDIWALGLIFYQCLSGILPTEGDNLGQVFKNVLARPFEPLKRLVPGIPEEISDICAHMLERDRDLRPADLREVFEGLQRHAVTRAVGFGPPAEQGAREAAPAWPRLVFSARDSDASGEVDPLGPTRLTPVTEPKPAPQGRRRFLWALLPAALLGLAALQIARIPKPERPTAIDIGFIAPLTGEIAETSGRAHREAALMAIRRVNEQGGLLVGGERREVRLVTEDDTDNPDQAVAAARKLINQNKVAAIVGLPQSRTAIPGTEVADRARVPVISTASSHPSTTAGKAYAFRIAFLNDFQNQVMARFAFSRLGARKAAVLYDVASAYNRDNATSFKRMFEEDGGSVVAFESYTTDANRDFSGQLQRIKQSGAEVLYLPNYSDDLPEQARQAREAGISAMLLGPDSWGDLLPEQLRTVEGGFYCSPWHPDIPTEEVRSFVEAYKREFGHTPLDSAAMTYDAFGILFEVIRREDKLDPDSIRRGLSGFGRYTGASGTMVFQGSGDPHRGAIIVQIKDNKPALHEMIDP